MTDRLCLLAGLCVCPDLGVFVSSSLDGTVCIWDEKNQLIRLGSLPATHDNSVMYVMLFIFACL